MIGGNNATEDRALLEITKSKNPPQWAIDIVKARIHRMTRAFRLSNKPADPKKRIKRDPIIYTYMLDGKPEAEN